MFSREVGTWHRHFLYASCLWRAVMQSESPRRSLKGSGALSPNARICNEPLDVPSRHEKVRGQSLTNFKLIRGEHDAQDNSYICD